MVKLPLPVMVSLSTHPNIMAKSGIMFLFEREV
jgi:hypothetical protein